MQDMMAKFTQLSQTVQDMQVRINQQPPRLRQVRRPARPKANPLPSDTAASTQVPVDTDLEGEEGRATSLPPERRARRLVVDGPPRERERSQRRGA